MTVAWRFVLLSLGLAVITGGAFAQDPVWRFERDGDLQGWRAANYENYEVSGGLFRGLTQYDPQLVSPPLYFNAADYPILEFRASSTLSGGGEVFWARSGEGLTDSRQVKHMLQASDEPVVYRVNLGASPDWSDTIDFIRLDLLNHAGAEVTLDYVRFLREDPGLVPNAGFEDDFTGDGIPDGWSVEAAQYEWSTRHVADGDRSLMVRTGREPDAVAVLRTHATLDQLGVFRLEALITHRTGSEPERIEARLRYYDFFGNPLGGPMEVLDEVWEDEAGRLCVGGDFKAPGTAAAADLELVIVGRGVRAWWDTVRLTHVGETLAPEETPMESWRAHWIWAEDTVGQDHVPAYLRKTIEIDRAIDEIIEARIQLTTDDTYELFLNGVKLGSTVGQTDSWREPELVDLREHLVQGTNVIAVLARDVTGPEGFLLEGIIRWPDHYIELLSDDSWKAVGEAQEGWMGRDFADGAWPAAHVIAPAGAGRWGNLPYTYLGPREAVQLVNAELPQTLRVGETLRVSAVVSHLPEAAEKSPLWFNITGRGGPVLSRTIPVHEGATARGRAVALGPVTVTVSPYLDPGEYDIELGFPRTEYTPGEGIVIGRVNVLPPERPEVSLQADLRQYNGQTTLFINDKPDSFMQYIELDNSPVRINNMVAAGVHIYQVDAKDIGWKGLDTYDYSEWDSKVMDLLNHDPQAILIPTLTLDGRHQRFWLNAHPEEKCMDATGSTMIGVYHTAGEMISLASEAWYRDSGEALRRFVEHCNRSAYAKRIIGYQPCSGVSWEWQHWGSVGEFEPTDYSEPMQRAFRRWVRRAYDDDLEKLRAAWNKPEITFETVAVPTVAERGSASHILFRDPRTDRYVIEFYKFYQDVMVDGIEHYFRIIKEATDYQTLCGTYYGYTVTMLAGARRAGDSGHYALHRLLQSDLCDFLVSPFDYYQRALGESYTVMSALGSVLLHGKQFVMQADLRTHLVTDAVQRRHGSPDTLKGTVSQLKRAFASATAKGVATQWYDFSHGWISRDPRQAQVIRRLRTIANQWVEWDRSFDPASIAVVVDEQSPSAYMGHQWSTNLWLVYRQKALLERVGAPWNLFLLEDITSGKLPNFRLYLFLNCFKMTDEQRQFITRNLQANGSTVVWMYAPGLINDQDIDPARITELTGFDVTQKMETRDWRIQPEDGHLLSRDVIGARWEHPRQEIGPVFIPQAAPEEIVGRWEESGEPALVQRTFDDWTSIYSAGPILSVPMLKNIARQAGVPVVVEGDDPSYVSRNFVSVHSAVPVTRKLQFDRPMTVTDLFNDEVLGSGVRELDVFIDGPDTVLLHLDPGL